MLNVTQIKSIKELREKEGLSITGIAKVQGIAWRTAQKYADRNRPVETVRPKQGRKKRVLNEVIEYIDAMLEEDLQAPAKQLFH